MQTCCGERAKNDASNTEQRSGLTQKHTLGLDALCPSIFHEKIFRLHLPFGVTPPNDRQIA